jgi:ribosomal protein L11 methylase PrmA
VTDPRTDADAVLAELSRLAQIAAALLDGEEIRRIITETAMHYLANPDPEHRFLSGDYFDVDAELFLRTKKLLLRIARLGRVEVSASVWAPVPDTDAVTAALHNGVHHRYYAFGQGSLPTPQEMRDVLQGGQLRRLAPDEKHPALATVLAPVRDSLGDVVAVVELTAPASAGAPPAWS